MNRLLCTLSGPLLKKQGLTPFFHAKIPPNDNGISLGQAVWAGGMAGDGLNTPSHGSYGSRFSHPG